MFKPVYKINPVQSLPCTKLPPPRRKFVISTSPIIHLVCPQNFGRALSSVSLGTTVTPGGHGKLRLYRFLGGKQGVLWGMWKWRT